MPLNHGLIDSVDVSLAGLPAALEGLRIAHVTDLHIRRPQTRHERMIRQLARLRLDMVVMTGDYTADPGYERPTVKVLEALCREVKPVHGIFAVCGNHDEVELIEQTRHLPIRWLNNSVYRLDALPLEMVGFLHTATREPDSIATLLDIGLPDDPAATREPSRSDNQTKPHEKTLRTRVISSSASDYEAEQSADSAAHAPLTKTTAPKPAPAPAQRIWRFVLLHAAVMLPTAADIHADLAFAGHTHGGQLRIPPGWPVYNSTDLPLRLTSGILRHRDTVCLVSRGLGENGLPIRFCCPPHVPVYTLHDGPTPGQWTETIENVRPW